jgi:hypothetical protein
MRDKVLLFLYHISIIATVISILHLLSYAAYGRHRDSLSRTDPRSPFLPEKWISAVVREDGSYIIGSRKVLWRIRLDVVGNRS